MITKKNYRVCIAFGDGSPKTTEVVAKNGIEAIDTAKALHPGARTVHVLGISDAPAPVEHPFFADEPDIEEDPSTYLKQRQIDICVQMRKEGKTHRQIAGYLGVGKTTVGAWLKQYG